MFQNKLLFIILSETLTTLYAPMKQNIDPILKSLLGIFGTTLSFALENISVAVSILAGLCTILYMLTQFVNEYRRGQWDKEDRDNN